MTNRAEVIAEIERLDGERTQNVEGVFVNRVIVRDQSGAYLGGACFEVERHEHQWVADNLFYNLAPQMAALIREQERRIEMLMGALRFYADADYEGQGFWDGVSSPKILHDDGDTAKQTLAQLDTPPMMEGNG